MQSVYPRIRDYEKSTADRKHHLPTRCSARGGPMKPRRTDEHRRRPRQITNEHERGYVMDAVIDRAVRSR